LAPSASLRALRDEFGLGDYVAADYEAIVARYDIELRFCAHLQPADLQARPAVPALPGPVMACTAREF